MHTIYKIILAFLFLIFAGCSSPHSVMQSWVGHREEELYQRWGSPTKTIDNRRDGKIVIYIPNSDNVKGMKSSYCDYKFTSNCIPAKTKEYRKVKLIYITALGNIYAWKMQPKETFHQ